MGAFLEQYTAQLIALASALGVGGIGALGALLANRIKAKVDERVAKATHELDRERAGIDRERAADERFKLMLDGQRAAFEALVDPIQAEVQRLREEVSGLHSAIDALRARYRAALDYVRQLRSWAARHSDADTVPEVPQTIADEV